jgi:hypothetical protein
LLVVGGSGVDIHILMRDSTEALNIKGPNPTPDELKFIDSQYEEYNKAEIALRAAQAQAERQLQRAREEAELRQERARAEEERKNRIYAAELGRREHVAVNSLEAKIDSFHSLYPVLKNCRSFELIVTVQNPSKETIKFFRLGWSFISENAPSCPSSIPDKQEHHIRLRPNDTSVLNIKGYDGPDSNKVRVCVGITGAEISP